MAETEGLDMHAWMGRIAVLGIFAATACTGDDATPADTDGTTGTSGSGTSTTMPTSADSSSSGSVDESSGGPTANGLLACDPREANACEEGICSGASHSGFYCRPACPDTAAQGEPCGDEAVCLSSPDSDALACFSLDDCAFLSGDPCANGDTCAVLTFEPIRTACVPSPGGDIGSSCGPAGALACEAGAACLGTDLDGDDPGRCQQWCVPGDALPSGCSQCIPLSDEIGTCSECSVLAQDCQRGQACQPVNKLLGGVCVDFGDGAPGDPCDPFDPEGFCAEGSLCLETDVDDVFACVETCEPSNPMCPEPQACVDFGVIVPAAESGILGVCIDGADVFCDPDAERPCPDGGICLPAGEGVGVCGAACDPTEGFAACDDNFACLPLDADDNFNPEPFSEGNGACGVGCTNDGECGGDTCLLLDGVESDGICGTTCTPPVGAECAGGETCIPTPGDPGTGACVADGTTCEKAAIGGCPTPAACVELDGGATAICIPSCFEQDPLSCGAVPANCQVKTDPRWHAGLCLGGEPCDPISPECGPEQTCEVVGGSAVGGVAFTCGDAGDVTEGSRCEDADCVEGLMCIDNTCREMCDPTDDMCSTGACTDVSATYYLPTDQLGACL